MSQYQEWSDPQNQDIEAPRLRDLCIHWRAKAPENGLLERSKFDIFMDFPKLAKIIAIIDVPSESDLGALRYRLVGTEVVNWIGFDPTGKMLNDVIEPNDWLSVQRHFEETIASAKPHLVRTTIPAPGSRGRISYERLLLPVSVKGEAVDQVISATHYEFLKQESVHQPNGSFVKEATIHSFSRVILERHGYPPLQGDTPDAMVKDTSHILG